ncbi:rsbT co-antagonist protein RsbR [Paenisporosarcina quisquiliarum]|uniref:STAS domain-containing protein n=1 Tax=Psychrobacillus psychrodurans TaxID=126157 RepID=UPI0008CD659A|nr:STAS domain-containing protein [Psychrobacillus psychrodurans]MCK1995870.1 STAS domain-containing protein [Psychrobacillus psychrodurans]SEM85399.1 rsbT co-antagonist protein RsbR [Paenisporosarcina quisquiliarum]
MASIDQELYDYILENSGNITSKWFTAKSDFDGSFYSNNPNPEIDQVLLEQHALTIRTVAYAFLEEENGFQEQLLLWAETVAKSRIEHNTPIHDVIQALNKTRETIWFYVEHFANDHLDEVNNTHILKWSRLFNTAFDQLIHSFSSRYYELSNNRLNAQQDLINELSIPIIPILDGVGVLPVIGEIDTTRARSLLEDVPYKCVEVGINKLFIDISSVTFMDTMVANEMFHLIDVLQLLGIKTSLSGIRPEVAQASIQLGVDFGNISTFSSLKQALLRTGVYVQR